MNIKRNDIVINSVSNLKKKNILTNDTKQYFMDYQLEQGEDKYWRYGVLRSYEDLYLCIIPKKENNKNLRNDVIEKEYDCSLIVSYMVVKKEWGKQYRFIELIDTFYPSNNLASIMMERYMKQYSKKLLPLHIIPSSVYYWRCYLLKYYSLDTKEDFDTFIKENKLLEYKNVISWEYLLETL